MVILSLRPLGFGAAVAWPPPECGQPVLETSFPTAFQRLDIRDGDLGVSLPGNQAKRRAVGWVLQNERFSNSLRLESGPGIWPASRQLTSR